MIVRLQRPWGKSQAVVLAVALALLCGGAALAASGVGTLVTGGEDGAATAHSAQAPVGSVSATPSIGVKSDVTSQPDTTDAQVKTLGEPNKAGIGSDVASGGAASGGGAAGSQLPFTGYLAIVVLTIGAALLLAGFVLRRRTPQDA